jgi:hypothetical protein
VRFFDDNQNTWTLSWIIAREDPRSGGQIFC